MNNRIPTVTCGFTLYNCADTISDAISSSINQEYPAKEILFVDDCSSDNTISVVRSLIKDTNIKSRIICLSKNMGVAYARNVLIWNCTSDYIAFFDDDDESHPSRLITQIKHLESLEDKKNFYKGRSLCYTDRELVKDNRISIIKSMDIDLSLVDPYLVIRGLLSGNPMPRKIIPGSTATCTLCTKVSTIKRIGGFDNSFRRFEDLDIAIKAISKGVNLTTVKECLVKQYFTDTADKSEAYKYNLLLIKKYERHFQTKSEFEYALWFVRLKNRLIHSSNDSIIMIIYNLILNNPVKLLKHILSIALSKSLISTKKRK